MIGSGISGCGGFGMVGSFLNGLSFLSTSFTSLMKSPPAAFSRSFVSIASFSFSSFLLISEIFFSSVYFIWMPFATKKDEKESRFRSPPESRLALCLLRVNHKFVLGTLPTSSSEASLFIYRFQLYYPPLSPATYPWYPFLYKYRHCPSHCQSGTIIRFLSARASKHSFRSLGQT